MSNSSSSDESLPNSANALDQALGAQFPKATLAESLRVAKAIERANGGQPYPPIETALAMELSPQSSKFRTLLSASSRRKLTSGAHTSKRITILDTGHDIVAPRDEESLRSARVAAALAPPLFKALYNRYRGKRLPADEYFINTLVRDFGVSQGQAERCSAVFREDMQLVGLLVNDPKTGATYLSSEPLLASGEADVDDEEEEVEEKLEGSLEAPVSEELNGTPLPPEITEKPERPKAIFIGHGKDKGPLAALKQLLDEYKLPYKVAQYEANAGRPIPTKVADVMKQCGAAILLFTPDEELRDLEGNPVWRPSENTGHELGAASVLFDNRIVIFKERTVTLPSNYSGIGYIEFDKHDITAKAVELFRELIAFGLVKISVG